MICEDCGEKMLRYVDSDDYYCPRCDLDEDGKLIDPPPDPEADLAQYSASDLRAAMADYFWALRTGKQDWLTREEDGS